MAGIEVIASPRRRSFQSFEKAKINPPSAGQIGGILVAWRIARHATIDWLVYG
jgi:hypothetical protein